MHASPVGRIFSKPPLRRGSPSLDLVGAGKEVVELQTGYPSEIRPPFGRVKSWRVIPLGLDPLGHLIESILIRSYISSLVSRTDQRGALWPHHQPGYLGECEVQP
jgi:hypothetical protein